MHFLFKNQKKWTKGNTIEEINSDLTKILSTKSYKLDIDKCIDSKKIENHILEGRIDAVKKFKINATPTLIINNEKFDKPITFKNLKKVLEKLI